MLQKLRFPLLLGVIAALLVAVGYWNIRPESFMQEPVQATSTEPSIDFYVVNARTVQYQPGGKRHYELRSERMEHIKASDVSLLTRPTCWPIAARSFRGTCAASEAKCRLAANRSNSSMTWSSSAPTPRDARPS